MEIVAAEGTSGSESGIAREYVPWNTSENENLDTPAEESQHGQVRPEPDLLALVPVRFRVAVRTRPITATNTCAARSALLLFSCLSRRELPDSAVASLKATTAERSVSQGFVRPACALGIGANPRDGRISGSGMRRWQQAEHSWPAKANVKDSADLI